MMHIPTPLLPLRRFIIGLLLVAVAIALPTFTAMMSPASAAPTVHSLSSSTEAGSLKADISSLTPNVVADTSGVKVTLRVTNTGSEEVTDASARLDVELASLDSLQTQRSWLNSTRTAQSSASVKTDVPDLAPGASANVDLAMTSGKLDPSITIGSLPASVTLTNGADNGVIRTTLPWNAQTQPFTKVSTSVIVPLTLPADPKLFTSTGADRVNAWRKAIGPGSDIDQLLSTKTSGQITWLIDPALLDPPTAIDSTLPSTTADDPSKVAPSPSLSQSPPSSASSGASNSSSKASTSSSTSSSDSTPTGGSTALAPTEEQTVAQMAASLRDRLSSLPSSQQVWFTPYGDPDLSSLVSSQRPAKSDEALKRALHRPLPEWLQSISTTIVAAPVEPLTTDDERRLTAAWRDAYGSAPTIITPTATLDGSADATVNDAVHTTSDGATLIGYNSSLSELTTASGLSETSAAALARSRSLAIYQQQPSTQRSLTVMGPRGAMSGARLTTLLSALSESPWTSLGVVSAAPPSDSQDVELHPDVSTDNVFPEPLDQAFTAAELASNNATLWNLNRFSRVLAGGDLLVPAWARTVDQTFSTRWRGHPHDARDIVQTAGDAVEKAPTHVSVVPSSINFFAGSGRITVTAKNDLARQVKDVQLELRPRGFALAFREKPQPVTIDAKNQIGIRVDTVAQAAANVTVDAVLSAKGMNLGDSGSSPAEIQINARPTSSWIFWVLGIVASLIFVYGVIRFRQKGAPRRDQMASDVQD